MAESAEGLVVKSHVARDLLQNAALFKSDKLAIWEYVVNGLQYVDPGINPRVTVTLDITKRRAVIDDNGRGMDWVGPKGLQHFFVMHGENVDLKEGKGGRGRFGTGKSAAFGIGNTLTITTVHNGKSSKVRLERDQIVAMPSGDAIPIETLEKEVPTNAPNGTVVEIDGIHLKSLDQAGIIKFIERHIARMPKNSTVIVNNHECEYQEPPVARESVFKPEGEQVAILGDVELVVKVSKTPLEKDLQGVSIFANGVWHETTLAGSDGREMAQYIFGDLDVPKLDEDDTPSPPFDLSRSMRLNPQNAIVQAIYAFVGQKIDLVRRELLEQDRKRKQSEEAKKLAAQASQIARIINEDFNEFRQKLEKVKAKVKGSTDLHDTQDGGEEEEEEEEDLLFGGDLPVEVVSPTGGTGHGGGSGGADGEPPELGELLKASPDGDKKGKPASGSDGQRKPRGGFYVEFEHHGPDSARALYVQDERTIFVNLDHPQIVAARGLGSTDEAAFRRLSYEVAFSEYALALAYELEARGEFIDLTDPIVNVRDTLNRVARKAAALYS